MRFKYYLRGAGIGVIAATLILSIAFLFHDNISDEEVIRRAMKLGMVMQENSGGALTDNPALGASSADLEGSAADSDPLTEPSGTGAAGDDAPDATGTPDEPGSADDQPPAGGDGQDGSQGNEDGQDSKDKQDGGDKDSKDKQDGGNDKDSKDKQDGDNEKDSKDKTDSQENQSDKTSNSKPSNNKPSSDKPSDSSQDSDEVEIVIESGDVSRMVSAKVFEAGLVDSADEFNSFLGDNDYDNMLQPGTYKIKKGSSFRQIAQILTRQ